MQFMGKKIFLAFSFLILSLSSLYCFWVVSAYALKTETPHITTTQNYSTNYYEDFYDESGVPTSTFTREPDGTEYRTVYENGQPKHTTMTRPDGTTETYDE